MTHVGRVKTMMCALAAITLIATLPSGSVLAANANERRKIVRFRPVTSTLSCMLGMCLDLTTSDDLAQAISVVTGQGAKVVHQLPLVNALAVEIPEDNLLTTVTNLLSSPYVLEVVDDLLTSVDPICPSTALPSIPESYPWGQQQIEVPAAHQQWPDLQASGVTVAVLDTGIAAHCEFSDDQFCLGSRVATGYNALTDEGSSPDDHGHGTHMAGIIAANLNSSSRGLAGVIGVAPQATLVPVKVLDQSGTGYLSDVVNGLQWVYNHDIRLVNMSFGFPNGSTPLKQAIESLYKKGVIMVVSAGNRCAAASITEDGGGDDCGPATACTTPLTAVTYPAAYDGVLAVGATDIHEQIPAYSLSGPQLAVVAPGGTLETEAPDDGQILSTNIVPITKTGLVEYGRGYGTSQAAAHVTGAIALALQLQPGLSIKEVRKLLSETAMDLKYPKEQQGVGRIDVEKMLKALLP